MKFPILIHSLKKMQRSYSFNYEHLKIKDEELSLNFEQNYEPDLISEKRKEEVLAEESSSNIDLFIEKEGTLDGQYLIYYPSKKTFGRILLLKRTASWTLQIL